MNVCYQLAMINDASFREVANSVSLTNKLAILLSFKGIREERQQIIAK
jgi:hypothetical protein